MSAIFGEMMNLGQRNGRDVKLRVIGDEFYARYETENGYTAVYDVELGEFCYANLLGDHLQSSGVSVEKPPPAGLVRHLQESDFTRVVKATAKELTRSSPGSAASDNVNRTFGPNQGLLEGRRLSSGNIKGLTILVNFQDLTSTVTAADVQAMLNSANYTANGNICSVNEYFKRVSTNKLNYTNEVVGPFKLSRNRDFYVNNLLVAEALQLAKAAGVNFKQFDSRNEGIVDAINILYAGQTQYLGELWPHNSTININLGSVRTDLYLLTSLGRSAADLSIGTFCHENGHLLCRFPDMYDYGKRDGDTTKSAGIGDYCLMGSGNHLDFGRSPSPVCAYLRDLAGWCDNEVNLAAGSSAREVKHSEYNTVHKFRTSKPNEYFLVENRSKMNLDRGGQSSGLAVYHCDIFGSNELQQGTASQHYQCALLQADGRRDLESDNNQGDGADLFGATSGIVLSNASNPSTREWDGRDSGLIISNITAPGATIKFQTGGASPPQSGSGSASPNLAIPDKNSTGVNSLIPITVSGNVSRIVVKVDIKHTFIGDLRVTLTSPGGRRAVLHGQLGGSTDNLVQTYDSASPGVLSTMIGQAMQGNWTLNVADLASQDVGTLRTWSISLTSASVG